jgi:hypothetical protein
MNFEGIFLRFIKKNYKKKLETVMTAFPKFYHYLYFISQDHCPVNSEGSVN